VTYAQGYIALLQIIGPYPGLDQLEQQVSSYGSANGLVIYGEILLPNEAPSGTVHAIHGTLVGQYKQHPIGIPVHDVGNRRTGILLNEICQLIGPKYQPRWRIGPPEDE